MKSLAHKTGAAGLLALTLTGIGAGVAMSPVASAANATTSASVGSYTTPQATNVRTGPGTNYSVVTTLPKGVTVSGVLQSSGWVKITSPGAYSGKYIYANVLTPSNSFVLVKTYYTLQTTNVRTGPGTNYSVATTLPQGTKIVGGLLSSGWVKITTPGADAGKYIYSGVLSATAPTTTGGTTPPSSGGGTTPPASQSITGWVMSSDHKINVRQSPSLSSPIVGSYGIEAQVTGTVQGDWIKTSKGYIAKGLIETTDPNIYDLNGYIPTSSLCAVPLAYNTTNDVSPNYTQNTTRYLNCDAVKGLNSLEAAYKAQFGHYALIDLTYRSHAEEVYWKTVRPNAASPVGTSNHGWGLAIDFHEVDDANGNEIHSGEFYWGQPGYNWLKANGSKYGFAGDPVADKTPYESYHWNFVG